MASSRPFQVTRRRTYPSKSERANTKRKNVSAIGLAYDDSALADIKAFVAKHPVSYPIAQVGLDNPPKDFDEPRGLPTTYLIAPDGTVAKRFVGPITGDVLAAAIAGQLADFHVAPDQAALAETFAAIAEALKQEPR